MAKEYKNILKRGILDLFKLIFVALPVVNLRSVTVALLVLGLEIQKGQAALITYSYSGSGSGTIGNTEFTDATFDLSMVGDTANLVSKGNAEFNTLLSATIVISGVGTMTFSETTVMFTKQINANSVVIGFSAAAPVYRDLIDIQGNFPGLDLGLNYQPVTGSNSVLSQFQTDQFRQTPIGTSLGNLAFTQMSDVTFQATAVPEPSTLFSGICLLTLAGVTAIRSRQKSPCEK